MRKQIFIWSLSILSLLSPLYAEISVKLSKHSVGINESFSIDFSSTQNMQGQPNFTPLQADFEILSCAQNHSTSIINNKMNVETSWHLVLQPKREGQLTIPSITIANDRSQPHLIEVTAARAVKQDDAIILETEITPKQATYEQTQLVFSVRLYRSVNLAQAGLSEVKVSDPDAIIERLGNDSEYEYMHANGTRYVVLERKYAIFPQHAGELNFSPILFEGQVIKGGNSFFNLQTEHKRLTSRPEKILVKPIPAPFNKNNWFAANDVKLAEEWSADPSSITVGEPVTWTLTVAADGCLGNQIPALSLNLPNNLKHYLDKPEITNSTNSQGYVGVRKIKAALIATKPDEITLPEITLKWWDLKSDQMRITQMPSRTIQVQDAPIAMNTTPIETPKQTNDLDVAQINMQNPAILPLWAWGLIGLNLIWIFSLLRAIFRMACNKFTAKYTPSDSSSQIKGLLKQACSKNDPKQAEIQLLAWAASLYPHIKPINLMGIKPHLSSALQNAIDELYGALYGQRNAWHGAPLWQAVCAFKPQRHSKNPTSQPKPGLRELYPG